MASESDDDDDCLAGLSRPTLFASAESGAAASDGDENSEDELGGDTASGHKEETGIAEEEESEDESTLGLVGAEAAFDGLGGAADELDPFRTAPGMEPPPKLDQAPKHSGQKKEKWVPGNHISQRKLFVGGLSFTTDDASLLKNFSRYGKVQEAKVIFTADGKPRGFGFVTYVHEKGSRYCLQQAGDPPKIEVDGRECYINLSVDKVDKTMAPGIDRNKLPARGALMGAIKKPGEKAAAAPEFFKRPQEVEEQPEESEAKRKRKNKKKEEIITISRRQDAEPLNKRPITMREIFPKEFWRI